MKLNGITFDGPKPVTCVIPLGDQELVFKIKPVLDYSEFEEKVPRPEPPKQIDNKGKKRDAFDHPKYLEEVQKFSEQRMDWMYIKALEDTDGLEWDKVDINNPETYKHFTTELKEIGLPNGYIDHFKYKIIEVCGLNPERIDEATERFLASQAQEQKSS